MRVQDIEGRRVGPPLFDSGDEQRIDRFAKRDCSVKKRGRVARRLFPSCTDTRHVGGLHKSRRRKPGEQPLGCSNAVLLVICKTPSNCIDESNAEFLTHQFRWGSHMAISHHHSPERYNPLNGYIGA